MRNVREHAGNRFFYLTDLRSAYRHVQGKVLAEILAACDARGQNIEQWLEFLKAYCLLEEGGLITGAPASPHLFNLYAGREIDKTLGLIARWHDLTYTRYLDDLTFSGDNPDLADRNPQSEGYALRRGIREVITTAGFKVHHRKSKVMDLALGPIVINGIGLDLDGRTWLPRHYLRKIRGMMHQARTNPDLMPKIHGMMGVFWIATDKRRLNRTERRVVRAYNKLHRTHPDA